MSFAPAIATQAERQAQRSIHVNWAVDLRGRKPAQEFFDSLNEHERMKVTNVFRHLESNAVLSNREKFKSVAKDLWEIKSHQVRLLGAFRPGGELILAAGIVKKKNELPAETIAFARRVLREHDLSSISSSFIRVHSPKPNESFKPSILVPQKIHTPALPAVSPQQLRLKALEGSEHVWAYVEKRDLLPPDCPLALTVARDPRIHNNGVKGELEAYVKAKLQALPIEARIAMGLLEDNLTHLNLGALWAAEFMASRELDQPGVVVEREPGIEEMEEPELELRTAPDVAVPEPQQQEYCWSIRSNGKRMLFLVEGDARKRSDQAEPVKVTRVFYKKKGLWSQTTRYRPQSECKHKASLTDPTVIEAIKARATRQ